MPPRIRGPLWLGLGLGIVLFAIGSIPYLLAPRACPDSMFTGVLGQWADTKQHLAFINHYQHRFVLPNVLATEPQRPFLLNLWFWFGGCVARVLHNSPLAAWHVLRALGLCVFCVATCRAVWRFVAPGRRAIAVTVALAPLSLAWLPGLVPGLALFGDASTIDASTVRYAFEQPQLSLSAGLVVYAVLGIDRFWRERGSRLPLAAIAPVVALWFLHPFEFWAAGWVFAVAVATMVRRGELAPGGLPRAVVGAVAMAAPALVFAGLDRWSGGELRALQKVHGDAWPLPWDLVLNLGLPCLVAVPVALGKLGSDGDARETRLLGIWLLATWVSLYLPPAPWRWHQVNGLQVCVMLLAVRAQPVAAWLRGRQAAACLGALALALACHVPYFLQLDAQARSCRPPAFHDRDTDAALDWLGAHAPADSHVLARPMLGLEVAMRSVARPYYGTWGKTPDWQAKERRSDRLLDGTMPVAEARALVDAAQIDYVVCNAPADAACRDALMAQVGLDPVFAAGWARIFGRALARPGAPPDQAAR